MEKQNIPPKKSEHPDNFWGAEVVHPQYLGAPGLVSALLPCTPGAWGGGAGVGSMPNTVTGLKNHKMVVEAVIPLLLPSPKAGILGLLGTSVGGQPWHLMAAQRPA